jgi:hypothetical protein
MSELFATPPKLATVRKSKKKKGNMDINRSDELAVQTQSLLRYGGLANPLRGMLSHRVLHIALRVV